nr:zf-HC2 domain-containing protein [uncultured Oscillibacter sp.]
MNCKIIQDLLPLYHDGVCSEESRGLVEEHLAGCEICRQVLADMDAPLPSAEGKKTEEDVSAVQRIAGEWRRGKWKSWRKGAAAAALACALLAGLLVLATQWMILDVDPAKIQVTDLRQLSDGRLIFNIYIDDNRSAHSILWEFGEDGDLWYVVRRTLLPESLRDSGDLAHDVSLSFPIVNEYARDSGVDAEIVRIWFGKGEDRVLLWKEGMEVPAASPEDEARYGFDQESAEYWSTRRS